MVVKTQWVVLGVVAVLACVVGIVGYRAEAGTDAAPAFPGISVSSQPAVSNMGDAWSVMACPLTKGGDVIGYNIYIFQEKTAMLWAWEYGGEQQLVRVPTRDQYEAGGNVTGASKPRGTMK